MLAVAMLVGILWLTGTPYRSYFDGAQFVHFLLGPATVALAVPLFEQVPKLRRACDFILAGYDTIIPKVGHTVNRVIIEMNSKAMAPIAN